MQDDLEIDGDACTTGCHGRPIGGRGDTVLAIQYPGWGIGAESAQVSAHWALQ